MVLPEGTEFVWRDISPVKGKPRRQRIAWYKGNIVETKTQVFKDGEWIDQKTKLLNPHLSMGDKGWFGDSIRHSLSRKGIKTNLRGKL